MSAGVRFGHGEFFGAIRRQHSVAGLTLSHRIAAGDVDPHTHGDAHFVWVTGGDYVTTADDVPPDNEATFVYNPVGTTHRDHFADGCGSFFTLSISAQRLGDWTCEASLPDRPVHVRHRAARGLTRKLMQECWDAPDSSLLLEGLCVELIGAVGSHRRSTSSMPPLWLNGVRETLETCYANDITLELLARDIGTHPVHLTRTFRKFFRCTPGEYLRSIRLEHAAGLLSRTKIALAEVALKCGFTDQSHFTKRFAHAHGTTPGEYRKLTTA